MHPYYVIRMLGGVLYLAGALLMAWNVYKTIKGDVKETADVVNPQSESIQPAE
jgi:cytochrome c oxidase cbb3-type subunit 1